jgi:hypothetical protein
MMVMIEREDPTVTTRKAGKQESRKAGVRGTGNDESPISRSGFPGMVEWMLGSVRESSRDECKECVI